MDDRIEKKLDEFYKDYAIDDLTSNDKEQLRQLAEAFVQLEDFNTRLQEELAKESTDTRTLKDLQYIASNTRSDIVRLQKDLSISRKDRSSNEESPVDFIRDLKDRALVFLKDRLSYIYCPKCSTLVANMWLASYDSGSEFKFICNRCDETFYISDHELEDRTNDSTKVVPTRRK